MKLGLFAFLGGVASAISSLVAFAEPPVLVPAPVERVFIPEGFDDNDNIEVILYGHFPDSCYKTGTATVKHEEGSKDVSVSLTAYRYQDRNCLKMRVPYIFPVKVGTLKKGEYNVTAQDVSNTLNVGDRNAETPDDYLYAPVEDAYLDIDDATTDHYVVISGTYPKMFVGCSIVKGIKTQLGHDSVLVVQPVMEILENDQQCKERGWKPRFAFRQKIEQQMPVGDSLVHVRVLNGNSLNKLEYIEK